MMEAAAAGISTERFWLITPRELRAEFKAASKRMRNDAQLAMFNAWQSANFLPRRKPLPPLQPMLDRIAGTRRVMSATQLRAALMGWHKAMGGSTRVVDAGTMAKEKVTWRPS